MNLQLTLLVKHKRESKFSIKPAEKSVFFYFYHQTHEEFYFVSNLNTNGNTLPFKADYKLSIEKHNHPLFINNITK